MKILVVTGNYLPGKNGGIENYTHWLACVLIRHDFEVEVAALNVSVPGDYIYQGIKINNLRGSFSTFETLLSTGNFSICHFHEYSEGGIEMRWFKEAKKYCNKIFFTFHLPYFTCYKNDFRYKGVEDCNTFSDSKRCAECVIADKIGYKNLAESDLLLNPVFRILGLTGTTKKLEEKIKQKYKILDEIILCCDQVFVIADWFKKILDENGCNQSSIKRIPNEPELHLIRNSGNHDFVIKNRLIFAGRIQQQKGLHLLCLALRSLKKINIQLDVYGNIRDHTYFKYCMGKFTFNFIGTVDRETLQSEFNKYDFLILPSAFTEMYPLVIREAFHVELPVIASTAKGNKELVVDNVNGFLFNYNDSRDLAITIKKAYALKREGWKPTFPDLGNPEKDIEEIVSYYH